MNVLPRRHYLAVELFSTDINPKDVNRQESRNLFR